MHMQYYCMCNIIIMICGCFTDIRNNTGQRSLRGCFTDSVKRKHLVTKQDCYNKRKRLGWNVSRHTDDAVSVDLLVKELQKESYDPILLYKPQGIIDSDVPLPKDRFMLAIQTELQRDMYRQYASTVVCIDSTHKTNVYDFKLVTLMVIDEYGEGKNY